MADHSPKPGDDPDTVYDRSAAQQVRDATRHDHPYIDILTEEGEATAARLTDPGTFGGAVAYRANPCIVIYGVPVWIMPNGKCRVGSPSADMCDVPNAVHAVKVLRHG